MERARGGGHGGVFISLTIYERMKRRRAHEKMHTRGVAVDPEHPFYRSACFGTERKRRTPPALVRGRYTEVLQTCLVCVCISELRARGPRLGSVRLRARARARDSRYPDGRGTMWRDAVQNTRPARRFSGRAALFITTAAGAQAATLCRHGRSRSQNPRDTAGQISFYYTCGVSAVG